jgi:hypothetical protein
MGLDMQNWVERKEKLNKTRINREMKNEINTSIVVANYL